MEHLNYCRQMVKQFSNAIETPNFPEKNRIFLSHAIDLAQASQKFILPDGGRLYNDPEYRALDESKPLKLPYPFIALEYSRLGNSENKEWVKTSKAILFARERDNDIVLTPAFWVDHMGLWGIIPEVAIPRIGYLDRTKVFDGYTPVPLSDYGDEIGVLLCLLNVLQCKNVHLDRSEPKKAGKKIKSALPFDTYHVLIIDVPGKAGEGASTGSHRSPREHLRRGHIRRLGDGRRIWVNASIVSAGHGGVVKKDYAVRMKSR